jgi:hypothetical protein
MRQIQVSHPKGLQVVHSLADHLRYGGHQLILDIVHGFGGKALLEEVGVLVDDVLDGPEPQHHFLVVAVAFGRSSGLDRIAHHHIDFSEFTLFQSEGEEVDILLQE